MATSSFENVTIVRRDNLLTTDLLDLSEKHRGCLEVVDSDKWREVFDGSVRALQAKYMTDLRDSSIISVKFL